MQTGEKETANSRKKLTKVSCICQVFHFEQSSTLLPVGRCLGTLSHVRNPHYAFQTKAHKDGHKIWVEVWSSLEAVVQAHSRSAFGSRVEEGSDLCCLFVFSNDWLVGDVDVYAFVAQLTFFHKFLVCQSCKFRVVCFQKNGGFPQSSKWW